MKELTLEIMVFDPIQIRDPERANACGCEVKCGRAAKTSGSHDQNSRSGEFFLSLNPHIIQQNMPRISRKLGR